jgi:response regulator NasT
MMKYKRILIVEDEIIIRMYIVSMLKEVGCEIVGIASSGEEAIDLALAHKPDLIFMDIMLSGHIDGLQAAHKIAEKIAIPFVYMSAYNFGDLITNALAPNYLTHLHKPIHHSQLIEILTEDVSRAV